MLAKVWKKVLLAICIIACIFNVMSKLVNRHSLKENLESANDGETIFNIFQKDEVVETESEPIIEGVMNPEPNNEVQEEKNNTTIVVEKTNEVETEVQETTNTENVEGNTSTEANTSTEVESNVTTEEKKDESFKFSDFTILFE